MRAGSIPAIRSNLRPVEAGKGAGGAMRTESGTGLDLDEPPSHRLSRKTGGEAERASQQGGSMRNAALMLGIIGGLIAMLVGFFGFGYTELVKEHSKVGDMFGYVDNPQLIRFASFVAPLLAIAGGAMAKIRAL